MLFFRADYECIQIELAKNYGTNEWREDLRKVMMKAGLENNPTVFLFSDTQVCWINNQYFMLIIVILEWLETDLHIHELKRKKNEYLRI